jgi:hypothetical protein
MPCQSTLPPFDSPYREYPEKPHEINWLEGTIKDNYQEKYPIQMEEIKQLSMLKKENNFLEAALCAILTELENRKAYNPVINAASKNGMIDIDSFWEKHKNKDEQRLSNELSKFSEHEKEILKRLLNDANNNN